MRPQLAVARRAIAEAVGLLDDLTGAPGFEDRHLMMAVEELLGNLDDVPDGLLSDIIAKAMRRAQVSGWGVADDRGLLATEVGLWLMCEEADIGEN